MSLIYKILSREAWAAAQAAGVFEGAPVDHADGFIHFSTALAFDTLLLPRDHGGGVL